MTYFLAGFVAMVLFAIGRKLLAREAPTPSPAESPALDPDAPKKEIPAQWGWAKVALASAGLKALGFYYRDKTAGPSFRVVVDLVDGMTDEAIRDAAHSTGFRGGDIVRLGAHETVSVEGLPPDAVAIFAKGYALGHGAAGPGSAVVLKLTSEEKRRYDLPERPPFVEAYL